jgi:hypothetical protein
VTVIVAVPVCPSLVAMMCAVPTLTAVTSPVVDETVAADVLSELQVIDRPVRVRPCESVSVAVACVVWIAFIELAASETVTVATGAGVTVTVALPLFPSLVAVILAVPTAIPLTTPCAETIATAVLLDAHVITRLVRVFPLASRVVAVACDVPTAVIDVGFKATVTVATGIGFTVIVAVGAELIDSLVAVTVAAPTPTAVTVAGDPLADTVRTAVLLDTQVTVRPVSTLPLASFIVAVND